MTNRFEGLGDTPDNPRKAPDTFGVDEEDVQGLKRSIDHMKEHLRGINECLAKMEALNAEWDRTHKEIVEVGIEIGRSMQENENLTAGADDFSRKALEAPEDWDAFEAHRKLIDLSREELDKLFDKRDELDRKQDEIARQYKELEKQTDLILLEMEGGIASRN